jgi:hypothetical protein
MASFSDAVTLLKETGLPDVVIPFFITYVVVYGVLQRAKWVESKELQAVIAFLAALAIALSPFSRTFMMGVFPPLVAFGMVLFMFLLVMFSSGMRVNDIEKIVGLDIDIHNPFWVIIIGIAVVVIVAGIAGSFPDAIGANTDTVQMKAAEMNMSVNDYVNTLPVGQRVLFFITLPQVLGLILLLLIFVFAGVFLTPP